LMGTMLQTVAQPHTLEQIDRADAVRPPAKRHPQQNVLQACIPLKQVKGLEYIAQVLGTEGVAPGFAEGGNVDAIEVNTAGIGGQNAGD